MKKTEYDYIIIGGGVAGLCAAIHLGELGVRSLIIEAGEYPAQKVCGEFLSPEALPILRRWGICPVEIEEAVFHVGNDALRYHFPSPAGGLSHLVLDPELVKRAEKATFLTNTRVLHFEPGLAGHRLELSNGTTLHVPNVIIATGRLPYLSQQPPKLPYRGIKAHFAHVETRGALNMFFFEKGYLGISPIEEGKCNVAALVRAETWEQWNRSGNGVEALLNTHPQIKALLSKGTLLFADWMTTPAPAFGMKHPPDWPHVYFVGDAAATIPPVTGNGLTLAIKSGMLAAEYAVRRDFQGFKKRWRQENRRLLFWGQVLHAAALHSSGQRAVCYLGRCFPSLLHPLYYLTR